MQSAYIAPTTPYQNVYDYGAVGDGIVDDTNAINRAIAAAMASTTGQQGRIVYLPSGTYKVTTPFSPMVSGGMIGDGLNATTINFDIPEDSACLVTASFGTVISGITFTHVDAHQQNVIQIASDDSGSNEYRVERCGFNNLLGPAIRCLAPNGPVHIVGNVIGDSESVLPVGDKGAIYLARVVGGCVTTKPWYFVQDNIFNINIPDAGDACIQVVRPSAPTAPQDFVITGNRFEGSNVYTNGVKVEATCDGYTIVDNNFLGATVNGVPNPGPGSNSLVADNPKRVSSGIPTPATAGLTMYSNTTPAAAWKQGPFNVLAFGADPTGIADSTAAFNAAFTALLATPPGQGSVYVPSGSYVIGGVLTFPTSSLIFGDGQGSSINLKTQNPADYCLRLNSCTLRDLAIINTDATGLGTVLAAGGSVISDCFISGNGANDPPAITTSVGGGALISITDCEISGVHLPSGKPGVLVLGDGASVADTVISGLMFAGCQAIADPNMALISVTAGVTKFSISNCLEGGGAFNYGCTVVAGASDEYTITGNDFTSATTALILDGGTGGNKWIMGNPTAGSVRNVTNTDTALSTDTLVTADATGSSFVETLPANPQKGWPLTVKKTDVSAHTVTLSSSANIDGATTYVLSTRYQSVTVLWDGTTWWVQ